ncbi:MAG TPA: EF-Tu/IF-2/RF-3 family GTPase [Pirellulales bacterium]|nr:EF-Tu/IF-2/RF-3 family GTPase [Pirellulales bacterium]HVY20593.1 EF-Tu/IF-2/RF-3 family GTPase [Bauldia sp.]
MKHQHLAAILVVVFATFGAASGARADDALFLPVEDSFVIAGMGVVATGTVVRGTIHTGDQVELVGTGDPTPAVVRDLQVNFSSVAEAGAGTEVSVILGRVEQDQVQRGRVIGAPGVLKAHAKITADVTLLAAGGRARPADDGYRPLLKIWTQSVPGTFDLGGGQIDLGATGRVSITLEEATVAQPGDRFDVTDGGRSVGGGVVVATQD